jgi:competence protein ComEC
MSKPSWLIIVLSYGFIISLLLLRKKYYLRVLSVLVFIALFILIFGFLKQRQPKITASILDVGHGDAVVMRFPNGRTLLIDGGDCTPYFDNGLQTVLPYLKEKGALHLTYVVITHGHKDHAGGVFSLINRVRIDTLVISDYFCDSPLGRQIIGRSKERDIAIRHVARGDYLYPDPTCRLYVLHPYAKNSRQSGEFLSPNNRSIVLKLQYGTMGILLTGDIEANGIKDLLTFGNFLECELIKLPHHGSMVSQTDAFLCMVNPSVTIASASDYRRFNLPSEKLLHYLASGQIPILLTGREGAIIFEITPNSIRRINWRQ